MYETSTTTCNVNYWLVPISPIKEINAQNIINSTCEAFNITKSALLGKSRNTRLVRARYVCMYVIRTKLKMNLKKIGVLFFRDHTTVIHALRLIECDLSVPAYRQETNEQIRSVIELL